MYPIERWKLSDLHPHPQQAVFFDLGTDLELETLAADVDKNGLRHPIAILPDGIILSGHRRVEAARRLGWEEIDVIVRHDLVGNPAAQEEFLITENSERRQLSPLARARCAKRLTELAKQDNRRGSPSAIRGLLRDHVGKLLGVCGRQADRFLRVLEAPMEIQKAFEAGELTIALASEVGALPKNRQQEIVASIGENKGQTREIVKRCLAKSSVTKVGARKIFRKLLNQLADASEKLDGQLEEVGYVADV